PARQRPPRTQRVAGARPCGGQPERQQEAALEGEEGALPESQPGQKAALAGAGEDAGLQLRLGAQARGTAGLRLGHPSSQGEP
ncbi:unnamed protein product, partial [Effrenium voratum]